MKKKLIAIGALLLVAAITGVTFAQVTGTASIGVSTAGVAGEFVNIEPASQAPMALKYDPDSNTATQPYYTNPSWSPIENAAGNITAGDVYYIDSTGYTGDLLVTLYLTNVPELGANYTYLLQQFNVYKRAPTEVPIAVGAETILTGAPTTIAAGTTQTLANKPVKFGSEIIKNDTTVLVRGTDYTIAYDTGTITFLRAITVAADKNLTAGYTYYTYASWAQATLADATAIGTVYLTLSNGYVSFILRGNAYYDITIDDGTFYCIDTTDNDTRDLAPSYYINVRQA